MRRHRSDDGHRLFALTQPLSDGHAVLTVTLGVDGGHLAVRLDREDREWLRRAIDEIDRRRRR